MAQGVLVVIEKPQGKLKKASLEALSAGRGIADQAGEPVAALCIGASDPRVAEFGADRVFVARHELLDAYSSEGYCSTLVQVAGRFQPRLILGAATAMGRDFLPRAAMRMRVGLAQECTELKIAAGEQIECVRPIFAGKAFATVRLTRVPAMATLRPNVFPLAEPKPGRTAETVEFKPELDRSQIHAYVIQTQLAQGQKLELTEANIIVSGGRGMKGPENFAMIQGLADALGGAMGASRAAVDAGWIDHQHQVGQTGKTVSPTLYIAWGISGAIQHLAGMSSSKYIVAINKDPEAPIFKVADYGIVGDLFTCVPALTNEVKLLKGS
ncbi:MAG: electron transfer flavoprotein subunit alpha/FixB family protein [Acidobacteriota bacterium]|jgi:electron transfer flavoprotein alpha subunit